MLLASTGSLFSRFQIKRTIFADSLTFLSGLLYVGVIAAGPFPVLPSLSHFNNIGPEERLRKLEQWNNTMIPACFMAILLFKYSTYTIWYFFEIKNYTPYLWANFCSTVCVLLIEEYAKQDEVDRSLLAIMSTVKKSYLR